MPFPEAWECGDNMTNPISGYSDEIFISRNNVLSFDLNTSSQQSPHKEKKNCLTSDKCMVPFIQNVPESVAPISVI